MGPLSLQVNRNKRSVALNLEDAADRAAFLDMLAGADVLLTNMRGGALERLGIAYDQLAQQFPRLIYAHGQGFASDSTQADRPGRPAAARVRDHPVHAHPHRRQVRRAVPAVVAAGGPHFGRGGPGRRAGVAARPPSRGAARSAGPAVRSVSGASGGTRSGCGGRGGRRI
nr:CoA transferase [Nocardia sp. CDC159]